MKLACVIHRFGADIAGGSEGHCRLIAEHLAARHDVTIVTTCAHDHITWATTIRRASRAVGPLRVLRFPVARAARTCTASCDLSDLVFADRASPEEQEQWFRRERPGRAGPARAPAAARRASSTASCSGPTGTTDAYFGLPLVADRAVLVPTAEEDPLIHVDVLARFFALPKGFLFLTPEEEALVATRAPAGTPSAVIGCGARSGAGPRGSSRARRLGVDDPFVLYLGRIDPNKGCQTLMRHFLRYADLGRPRAARDGGSGIMPIPAHP